MKRTISLFSAVLLITSTICLLSWASPAKTYCEETAAADDFDKDFEFMEEEFGESGPVISDPLAPVNRVMFHFNDRLYFWVLKPVARGYGKVVPHAARTGVDNFFNNVRAPIRIVGSLLQLKGEKAMAEFSRFVFNTTVGVLGVGNPAKKHARLNPSAEDLGQVLAHYGFGNGFYLVLPVLGPSSLRDAIGAFGDDYYLDPVTYVEPKMAYFELKTFDVVNSASLRIGDYETLKNSALKPYEAFRDAYVQHRNSLISK